MLACWHGKIKPGSHSNEIMCHVDLMATVTAIIGEKLPDNAGDDNYNILPVLLGHPHNGPIREATVHHSCSGHFAIRKGPWVLIDYATGDDNHEPDWFKRERGYTVHRQPGELFDLRQDLPERRNLYAERPETMRELKELLEKYKREGRSTPGKPQETVSAHTGGAMDGVSWSNRNTVSGE